MRNREIARFLLFGLAACLPFFLLAAASSREMLVVCVAQAVLLLSGFTLFTLRRYQRLRQLNDLEKKPSTSELIDWLRALVAGGVPPKRITAEIPFAGVLLKKDKDLRTLARNKR